MKGFLIGVVFPIFLIFFSAWIYHDDIKNYFENIKTTYIQVDGELLSRISYRCELGMLLNDDGENIFDENSKPITCDGYIKLTKKEKEEYLSRNMYFN